MTEVFRLGSENVAMRGCATSAYRPQAQLTPSGDLVLAHPARRHDASAGIAPKSRLDLKRPVRRTNWVPWIFAAKTTASGLIALLVSFTFNLDEPYWALLTVFIVAQPQQSGQVLAKSFYRIIGTVIGAAVALFLVALCAQERVLFLGGLALWIGLCTFGSQYARNWAAYAFVLSGYTVAIVGIPGALDAGNAFYDATGRVTEISLGIIVAATISHVVLPDSLIPSLWRAVADAHAGLADYAVALFGAGDTTPLRTKHGSTAAVLGAVATARLATMAPAVPVALGATLIFALATLPAFIIVEVLLPLADGFAMFALAVAPMRHRADPVGVGPAAGQEPRSSRSRIR